MIPRHAPAARPTLYAVIFAAWAASLVWFHPRLIALLGLTDGWFTTGALRCFIPFAELAWLYGIHNVGVVVFALVHQRRRRTHGVILPPALAADPPAVTMLYLTCNDFVEQSADACLAQDYPHWTLYILDDSSDAACRERVDAFALRNTENVRVVRRPDRAGVKAGNTNHGLRAVAVAEPVFALVDADEVLPRDFLRRTVPMLLADERCGFLPASQWSNPAGRGALQSAVGVGIDLHWRWYHPLRNRYGFVMLLGHGAVIRRQVWEGIGGFPEIVSEDLSFSLRARQHGWQGDPSRDRQSGDDCGERCHRITPVAMGQAVGIAPARGGRQSSRSPAGAGI